MAEERAAIGALRAQVRGTVLIPGDSGYDDACRPWNLAIEQHPPVVVLAADSSRDVRLDPSSRRLHIEAGALLNFLGDGDVGEARVRAVYSPDHYRRLVALKNTYDPDDAFRFNRNIRPFTLAPVAEEPARRGEAPADDPPAR